MMDKENKMSGPRNLNAGNSFERTMVQALKLVGFPHVTSARWEGRSRDGQKVDIMNKDEAKNGRLRYNFQCKNITKTGKFSYAKVLSEMPEGEEINVILHNQTFRSVEGNRFFSGGQYAHLGLKDFMTILKELEDAKKAFRILNEYFDYLPEEDKARVSSELESLGY
jgi:hypothetical protein